jgi:hypothetical protein
MPSVFIFFARYKCFQRQYPLRIMVTPSLYYYYYKGFVSPSLDS